VRVVGALPPTPTFVTNYAIYPFVGVIEPGFAWVMQHSEVAEVLELGRAVGRAPRRVVVLGVEGCAFELGDAVTPEVAAALDEVVAAALEELARNEEPCTSVR